jgi:hypothetical protein
MYGVGAAVAGLETPAGVSPARFLISVLVTKIGTALAFVGIFYVARDAVAGRWLFYAFLWWLMFAIGEVRQMIGPNYTWKEAVAGGVSEAVYLPLSAYLVDMLLR